MNTDYDGEFQSEKTHYYFCPKIVGAKWGLPPKNVADPEKRLSMHALDHLQNSLL